MKSLAERMPHPSKCFNTTGNSWELDCSQELEVKKKATWLLLTEASEHLHRQLQSHLRQDFHSLEPRLRHNPRIHTLKKERLTLVRMSIIKMSTDNTCWRRCGEKRTLLHCWCACKLVQPLWITVWRFLKKLKMELPLWSNNPTPGHISRKDKNSK